MGRFGRVHGVRGDIYIISFTDPPTNILNYRPWLIESKGQWIPIEIVATKMHGDHILAHIADCDDRDQAKLYTNKDIAVAREVLPKLAADEYYFSDITGMTVIDQHGKTLGEVDYVLETGANDVLVIKGERELLVPYIKQAIVKVDPENRTIYIDWDFAE
jgi:16S rRNA processing protein RimM